MQWPSNSSSFTLCSSWFAREFFLACALLEVFPVTHLQPQTAVICYLEFVPLVVGAGRGHISRVLIRAQVSVLGLEDEVLGFCSSLPSAGGDANGLGPECVPALPLGVQFFFPFPKL